ELAVIEVTAEGLLLKEIATATTIEAVQSLTQPKLTIAKDLVRF
ncbi:MAG: succinyl-CoA--3-ketoacid-CoA transferase, partial [Elusimicrobiota bacterium]